MTLTPPIDDLQAFLDSGISRLTRKARCAPEYSLYDLRMYFRQGHGSKAIHCGRLARTALFAVLPACWPVALPLAMGEAPLSGPEIVAAFPGEEEAPVDAAKVRAVRDGVEADSDLEQNVKESLLRQYDEALEAIRRAETYQARREAFLEAAREGPDQTAALRGRLAGLEAEEVGLDGLSLDQLQEQLETRRTRVTNLETTLREQEQALGRLFERPVEISERLAEITEALNRRENRLSSPELAGEVLSPGYAAERTLLMAEKWRLENEQSMLRAEQNSQAERESFLRAELDFTEAQLTLERQSLREVEARLANQARKEADRAARTAGATPGADPQLVLWAAEVQELTSEYNENIRIMAELSSVREEARQRVELFRQEFEVADAQLRFGPADEAMAPILFEFLRRLREQRLPMEAIHRSNQLLDASRLAALRVEEKLRNQRQVEMELGPEPEPALKDILALRREWLMNLRSQYRALIREAASFKSEARETLVSMQGAQAHLSHQLFTVRSVPPVRITTLTRLPGTTAWFFQGEHFFELGQAVTEGFRSRPMSTTLLVLLILGLLARRPVLLRKLRDGELKIRRIRQDRYGHTMASLFWTLLLAAPLPLALLYFHWAVARVPEPSDWLWGLQRALPAVTGLAFGIGFLMAACRPFGLAAHFGWSESTALALRRVFFLFAIVYLPAMLVVGGALYGERTPSFESLTRVTFIVAHLWVAGVAWRMFKIGGGGLGQSLRGHPDSWLAIKRPLWHGILVAVPLGLAIAAALGYLVTAITLSTGLLTVAGWIAGVSLSYWLILRWFMIRERHLALGAALEKRRRARMEARAAENPEATTEEIVEEEEPQTIDLSVIGDQTRQLLRSLYAISVVGIILIFLARAVPMLAAIDQWQIVGTLSPLELIQIALVITITVVGTMNLPGFLDLAVLHPMNVAPGTRHAIKTLGQYALITIGFALVFHLLQIDWAKFGWIAAALSVGLGFGLQEVVSNFVCGLILLFERPIRIGDVVTVEGITGTVTKIRMRATTITSHDRQEFLVPNKNFVTGTLLNWTLTSPLNRVTVPVGVAYGSDTATGMKILREIADENPMIMDDPAPLTSFEGFDDSSLNLVLRVYLPDMSNRLTVITDLHQEIHRRFAEAGIEIAFPQRDLNLGTGWEKVFGHGKPPSTG